MDTQFYESFVLPILLIVFLTLYLREASKNGRPGLLVRLFKAIFSGQVEGEIYPYVLNKKFLSPAELTFLHVLKQATENKPAILTKVNLGDLFYVQHKQWQLYRAKIDRKHVDFLICHPKTYQPVLGIELDDSSHNSTKAKARDEYKDNVFKSAGLPLLRIPVQHTYNTKELQQAIFQAASNGRFQKGSA